MPSTIKVSRSYRSVTMTDAAKTPGALPATIQTIRRAWSRGTISMSPVASRPRRTAASSRVAVSLREARPSLLASTTTLIFSAVCACTGAAAEIIIATSISIGFTARV